MAKYLLELPFMNGFLTIDSFGGDPWSPDLASVSMSLRKATMAIKPGRRIGDAVSLNRTQVMEFALAFLDLYDQMLPATLKVHDEFVPKNEGFREKLEVLRPPLPALDRAQFAAKWDKANKRIATLQLAKRVLENCDDLTEATLAAVLVTVEKTGGLPFSAAIAFNIVDGQLDESSEDASRH
jgi:hypothetical protein